MRVTFKLIVSLVLVVASVATFSAYYQVQQERQRQQEDLQRRSRLLAQSLEETVTPLLAKGPSKGLQRLVEKFGNRERLAAVAVYDAKGTLLAITASLSSALPTAPEVVTESLALGVDVGQFDVLNGANLHIFSLPLRQDKATVGSLVLFHDASYIHLHLARMWRHAFMRVLAQTVLITLVTLLIVRWTILAPMTQTAEWMKKLRLGETDGPFILPKEDLFAPIAREVTTLAKNLVAAKTAAEEEAKLRQAAESLWTPDRLKEHVKARLQGKPLFVVSNREPYMHVRKGRGSEVIVPAGGLVTALDPVLRASGGTWIAHGAGDGDWDVVDEKDRIRVPPDDPLYTLRRVFLSKEEEDGYYYGFSNEGLWPLCHIAHTRPIFRKEDWTHYQKANLRFGKVVLDELEGVEEPCVLIQDYHFALLPRLIKDERPDARIAIFWHVPWPNPEAFGICPWQKELLYGMLGADLIGFHTQFHCNNFLDTVDRVLESRINWERFAVTKAGHDTLVKPFPISVAFPHAFQDADPAAAPKTDRAGLLKDLGVKAEFIGVGVERMDYTKGVLERLRGVERFLEKYPAYRGRFTFVQLGAPSRTHIKRYHDFLAEVQSEVERINWKFKSKDWRPVVYLEKHHSHREIMPFYKEADVCMVTSLHDGMNLVAKEFVAAREDESGVLILSRFAGASRELRDALIINPYDIEQMADALRLALEMEPDERAGRMKRMRETIKENNIYRWAANLLTELSSIRLESKPAGRIA
ncbi:MAG: trehalose-6-phosphate synthase [Elusimicrobia bacterium]|nr:trehalose-6-phosphate synthase [Elusimicrobiota bacterium]